LKRGEDLVKSVRVIEKGQSTGFNQMMLSSDHVSLCGDSLTVRGHSATGAQTTAVANCSKAHRPTKQRLARMQATEARGAVNSGRLGQ
jgi:hypothetical protein